MKKITKAQVEKAPKYIAGIDWTAAYKPMTIDLVPLESTDLRSAMIEATEKCWQLFDERIWCLSIYEKAEVSEDKEIVRYKECLTAWTRGKWEVRNDDDRFTCSYMTRYEECFW